MLIQIKIGKLQLYFSNGRSYDPVMDDFYPKGFNVYIYRGPFKKGIVFTRGCRT